MYGAAFGWGGATAYLIGICAASAATGIGPIIAVGAAMGISVTSALTGFQIAMAVIASQLYIKDRGFKAESYSAWIFTVYTGVKAL